MNNSMNKEIWKDIPGYEGLYQASNIGRIRSIDHYIKSNFHNCKQVKRKGKIIKQFKDNYYCISININGKIKRKYVHRLVTKTFIPNPEDKPQVNHIDGNKLNNNVNNLEWCTRSENMKHAWDNKLQNNKRDEKGRFI